MTIGESYPKSVLASPEVCIKRNMLAGQGNVQSDAEDEVGEDIPMEEEPLAPDEERESLETGVYK